MPTRKHKRPWGKTKGQTKRLCGYDTEGALSSGGGGAWRGPEGLSPAQRNLNFLQRTDRFEGTKPQKGTNVEEKLCVNTGLENSF